MFVQLPSISLKPVMLCKEHIPSYREDQCGLVASLCRCYLGPIPNFGPTEPECDRDMLQTLDPRLGSPGLVVQYWGRARTCRAQRPDRDGYELRTVGGVAAR